MIAHAHDFDEETPLAADICVVGAGPVGIALALALARGGRSVLLLEAGGETDSAESNDFYRGAVTDPALHTDPADYRARRLGGTSTMWGGRCMPLDPIDFERRDWIPDSGWPITHDALDAYYPEAVRLCEAGDPVFDAADPRAPSGPAMIAGFTGTAFTDRSIERMSCPTDFGRRYRAQLERAPNIRLVLEAAVTAIGLDHDGRRVENLTVRRRDGRRLGVKAREIVLALGGLETTRLLLASRDVQRDGIGNAHDVLGRYYMCHLAGTIGRVTAAAGTGAIWHGYDVADDGTYCRRRLALTAAAQREHGVGNFIARLHHPTIGDPSHATGVLSALYLARALVPRAYRPRLAGIDSAGPATTLHHAFNVLRDPAGVAGFAARMLIGRKLAARKFPSVIVAPRTGRFTLDFHAEQETNRDSRVMLGEETDRWGMPRLRIDWRYTAGDVRTVATALALLRQDFARSGAATLDYDEDAVEREMIRYGAYPGHHIGTARMGDDPRRSVVDRDCRVHGVGNLWVAGTAVFPTSSQANPTLSAIALALRLADHLAAGASRVPAPAIETEAA